MQSAKQTVHATRTTGKTSQQKQRRSSKKTSSARRRGAGQRPVVQKSYNQAADDYEDESMDEYGDQGQQKRAVRRRRGGQRRNEKENSGGGYEYDDFDDDDDHGDVAGGGDEVAEEEEGKTSKPLFFDYQQQLLQQEQERLEQEQGTLELEGRGFQGSKLPMTVDTLYISGVSDTDKMQRTCFAEGEEEALDAAAAAAEGRQDQTKTAQRKRALKELFNQRVASLSSLETAEIIFALIDHFGSPKDTTTALQYCTRLSSLSLIKTGTTSLFGVTAARSTLRELSLIQCRLQKISAQELDLPNLTSLFLQQNQISSLPADAFCNCPRLRRLWLYGNRISKIQGLHACGDLREVYLQDNRINSISGFGSLSNLRELRLSANRISDFKDVQRLSTLPSLETLALEEDDFGGNPVTRADGYRHFVLCVLKRLRVLDDVDVLESEREASDELYMNKVLDFNKRVEAVRQEHDRELLAIEARRRRNLSNSDSLHAELRTAFAELDGVIADGSARIKKEHEKQMAVRRANAEALDASLSSLVEEYNGRISTLLEIEKEQHAMEELWYGVEATRLRAEQGQALRLIRLKEHGSKRKNGSKMAPTIFQELSEHVPDYFLVERCFACGGEKTLAKALAKVIVSPVDKREGAEDVPLNLSNRMRLLKAYKVYNGDHQRSESERLREMGIGGGDVADAEVESRRMFFGGSVEAVHDALRHGFAGGFRGGRSAAPAAAAAARVQGAKGEGGDGGDQSVYDTPATMAPSAVMLHSDPYTAASFSLSATDEVDELFAEDELRRADPSKTSSGGVIFNLLMCRVTVPRACTQRLDGPRPLPGEWTDGGSFDEEKEEESKESKDLGHAVPAQPFKFSGLCTSSLCQSVLSKIPMNCHAARVAHHSSVYANSDDKGVEPHDGTEQSYDDVVIESADGSVQSPSQRHSSLLVPCRNAALVVPECILLCQLLPEGTDLYSGTASASTKRSSKKGAKAPLAERSLESVLDGLTIPSVIGNESVLRGAENGEGDTGSAMQTLLSQALALTDSTAESSLSRSATVASHATQELNTSSAGAVLNQEFRKRLLQELLGYQRRVWQEINPSTASKLDDVQDESRRLRKTLETLRKQIDGEKTLQEQILRDFRNQFNHSATGSGGGGGSNYSSSASSKRRGYR